MKIEVLKEEKNLLFPRKEVELLVQADVTPSMIEAKEILKNKFSCDEDLIRIIKIESKFGSRDFLIIADIYDSIEDFNNLVKKTKKELEEEKKAFEAQKAKEEEERKAKESAEAEEKATEQASEEEGNADETKEEQVEEKTE